MIMRCGACGEKIEVPDSLIDGQHVRCPFCNEKTTYSKPARIELPVAADTEKNAKPKLAVRRPQKEEAYDVEMEKKLRKAINVQSPAVPKNTPSGTISAAEERVRMYENMRQKNARTRMLKNFFESAILLMLLATIVGLFFWWQDHKSKMEAEAARVSETQMRIEAERNQHRQELRERERRQREAALAKEREARERENRELRGNKERYLMYMMALTENRFDLFTKSVTNDIASTGGELCYLFPQNEQSIALYHVLFETNGTKRISRMEENGRKEDVATAVLNDKISKMEYLVAKGDTVYFKSLRKTPPTGVLNSASESDPAETFFGALAPVIKIVKPTYDELTFDIFFTPKGATTKIFVENLPFGGSWSMQHVRDAVEKNTTIRTSSYMKDPKRKKFRRTVKIYNGLVIMRGIDGITYVPRTPPPDRIRTTYSSTVPNCIYRTRTRTTFDNTRERWQALFSAAQQEDAAEAAYYERLRQSRTERRNAAQAADEQRWRDKVEDVLRNGTLSYRIRKAKVSVEK